MLYILSTLFALLIVSAQSIWKLAVQQQDGLFNNEYIIRKLLGFAFSPLFIAGVVLYIIATLLYLYMLSRYQYSYVQLLAIPLSLIFSIISARIFFGESLQVINYLGVITLLVGIVLVTIKLK